MSARHRSARLARKTLRRGFTLVEMLIAMALTLILVYAIAEFYAYVGETVKDGRASITMGSTLRTATHRLKTDLDLLTYPFPMVPWADDGSSPGYFEILEGPCSDIDLDGDNNVDADSDGIVDIGEDSDSDGIPDYVETNNTSNLLGDGDDILAFTIRSSGEPFVGRWYNSTTTQYEPITSNLAEVVWFTSFSDTDGDTDWDLNEPRFLCRRQLLIRPDLTLSSPNPSDNIFHHNDVSANSSGTANTLADLTRRENRFARQLPGITASFPYPIRLNPRDLDTLDVYTLKDDFAGEDRLLSNLLAFDVRAFDTQAELRADDSNVNNAVTSMQPGDPGWSTAVTNGYPVIGNGAFVDLFYSRYTSGTAGFANAPNSDSRLAVLPASGVYAQYDVRGTYCTWALSYERDYVDQDDGGAGPIDEATNGLDDDGMYGVDDPDERETSPPYPVPLRGIQVKIRLYDPGTRQMRQGTVGADFIAE